MTDLLKTIREEIQDFDREWNWIEELIDNTLSVNPESNYIRLTKSIRNSIISILEAQIEILTKEQNITENFCCASTVHEQISNLKEVIRELTTSHSSDGREDMLAEVTHAAYLEGLEHGRNYPK